MDDEKLRFYVFQIKKQDGDEALDMAEIEQVSKALGTQLPEGVSVVLTHDLEIEPLEKDDLLDSVKDLEEMG